MIPKFSSVKRSRSSGGGGSAGKRDRSRTHANSSLSFPVEIIEDIEVFKNAKLLASGDLLYGSKDNTLKCCWWDRYIGEEGGFVVSELGQMEPDTMRELNNFADIIGRTGASSLRCKAKVVFCGSRDGSIDFYDFHLQDGDCDFKVPLEADDSVTCMTSVGEGYIIVGTEMGNLYYVLVPDMGKVEEGLSATKITESRGLFSSFLGKILPPNFHSSNSCPGAIKKILYYPNNESLVAWCTTRNIASSSILSTWSLWKSVDASRPSEKMHKTSEVNLGRIFDSLNLNKIGIGRRPDVKIVLDVAVIPIPDQNYNTMTLAALGLVAENASDVTSKNHLVLFILETKLNFESNISSVSDNFCVKSIVMVAKNVMYSSDLHRTRINPRFRVVCNSTGSRADLSSGDLFVIWGDVHPVTQDRNAHAILVSIKNVGSALLQEPANKLLLVRNSFYFDSMSIESIYSDNIFDSKNGIHFLSHNADLKSFTCIPPCDFITETDDLEKLFIFILNTMGSEQLIYKEISKYVIDKLQSTINARDILLKVARKICDGDINPSATAAAHFGSELEKSIKLLNNSSWKVSKRFELLDELVKVVNTLVESEFLESFPDNLLIFIESIACCYELRKVIMASVSRRDRFLGSRGRDEVPLLAASAAVTADSAITPDLSSSSSSTSLTLKSADNGRHFEENSIIETVEVIRETIDLYCRLESNHFFENVSKSIEELKTMGLAPDDLFYGKCSAVINMIHYFKINYEQRPIDLNTCVYSLHGVLFLLFDVLIKTKDYTLVSTMTVNESDFKFRLIGSEKVRHTVLFFGEALWINLRSRRQHENRSDPILFDESCFRNIHSFLSCLQKWSIERRAQNHINHEDYSKALQIFFGLSLEMGYSSEHIRAMSLEFNYLTGFFISFFREYPEDIRTISVTALNDICIDIDHLFSSREVALSSFAEKSAEYIIQWLQNIEEERNLIVPMFPKVYLDLLRKCKGGMANNVIAACVNRYPLAVGFHRSIQMSKFNDAADLAKKSLFENRRTQLPDDKMKLFLSLGKLSCLCSENDETNIEIDNGDGVTAAGDMDTSMVVPSAAASTHAASLSSSSSSLSSSSSSSDFDKRMALLRIKQNFEASFGSISDSFPDCIIGPNFYDNLKMALDFIILVLGRATSIDSELNLALGERKALYYSQPLASCLALVAMMHVEMRSARGEYLNTCREDIHRALIEVWKISILSQNELWLSILNIASDQAHVYIEHTIFCKLLLSVHQDVVRSGEMFARGQAIKDGDFLTRDLVPSLQDATPHHLPWSQDLFLAIDSFEHFEGKMISHMLISLVDFIFQDNVTAFSD